MGLCRFYYIGSSLKGPEKNWVRDKRKLFLQEMLQITSTLSTQPRNLHMTLGKGQKRPCPVLERTPLVGMKETNEQKKSFCPQRADRHPYL